MAKQRQIIEGARLSGEGQPTGGTIVKITADIFPHVKGEIKRLSDTELDRIADIANDRGYEGKGYKKYELTPEDKEALARDVAAAEKRVLKAAEGVTA